MALDAVRAVTRRWLVELGWLLAAAFAISSGIVLGLALTTTLLAYFV